MTAPMGIGQFVGAPLRAHAFDGVSLAENAYAAGLRVAAHVHDAPLLSLVLQGSATEEVGTRSRELDVNSLLYTPA
jgi:AraC family transcriptional regulator